MEDLVSSYLSWNLKFQIKNASAVDEYSTIILHLRGCAGYEVGIRAQNCYNLNKSVEQKSDVQ